MQSRVRMSQIYGRSQARHLTQGLWGFGHRGQPTPHPGCMGGSPCSGRKGAGQMESSGTALGSAGSVVQGYLDCLVGATV